MVSWRSPISRRLVLLLGGGAILSVGVGPSARRLPRALVEGTAPTATLRLIRPQDMLVLDFDFHNLAPSFDTDPPQLRRVDSGALAYVVVRFEPQHLMEATVWEDVTDPPAPGAVRGKGVGPSRLAFVVPETVKSLPYTEEGLLRWWPWILQAVPSPPAGSPPGALHSDLLVVDWLHLTPEREGTWAHAAAPVVHGARTELWHTRLAVRGPNGRPRESIGIGEPDGALVPKLRAVHRDAPSGDERSVFTALYPPNATDPPGQIVELAGNRALGAYRPVDAGLLALSAMGATLDLDAHWGPSAGFDLKGWKHTASVGRDTKVVVEEYGFLFPFGHRAELVSETKRIVDEANGVAYLRQRQFIRLTERTKTYPAAFQKSRGRAFPFTDLTITTPAPPDLPKEKEPLPGGPPDTTSTAFWVQDVNAPKEGGGHADVVFSLSGTDVTGRRVAFTSPLAFMPAVAARNTNDPLHRSVLGRFGTYDDIAGDTVNPRRVIDLRGQDVAYAEENRPGTTSFPTVRWFWGVEGPDRDLEPPLDPGQQPDGRDHAPLDSPVFYPRMFAAEARVPAIDAVIGPGGPVFLVHDAAYLEHGFGHLKRLVDSGDDARIFVRVQSSVAAIAKAVVRGDRTADAPVRRAVDNTVTAGGIANPDLAIGALSDSRLGPISGLQDSIDKLQDSGEIKFDEYFPNLGNTLRQAAIFGEIALGKLFKDGPVGLNGPQIYKITDYPLGTDGLPRKDKKPIGYTISFEFVDTVKLDPPLPLKVHQWPGGAVRTTFSLQCSHQVNWVTNTPGTGNRAVAEVAGSLREFDLVLGYLRLVFTKLAFTWKEGGGASLDPDIDKVEFEAPLDVVKALGDAIMSDRRGPGLLPGERERGEHGRGGRALAEGGKKGLGFKLMKLDLNHIGVGVTFDIPSVPLGFFALDGIHFEAGVILPFSPALPVPDTEGRADRLRLRFAFGAPDEKFKVSVYGLGGGGHFEIEVSSRQIEKLDASLEVIGNVALDLAVAAGRVLIELGVFFRREVKEKKNHSGTYVEVHLGGYLRISGRFSVLGLISLNLELYADAEYVNQDGTGGVFVHAHVTVSIDLTFWHVSVGVSFTKTFLGADRLQMPDGGGTARAVAAAPAPATFGDLVGRDDWTLYCASFAA
ncbi:hypothetical protein [Actinomadura roseirufa]|uniref:hypothetical protein n=1 Tax=Actinomadura roseirufa TaxID=2094049 RepID=UPI0013F15320|nr:hypothetical protein [Actinomadura roseirufa]